MPTAITLVATLDAETLPPLPQPNIQNAYTQISAYEQTAIARGYALRSYTISVDVAPPPAEGVQATEIPPATD